MPSSAIALVQRALIILNLLVCCYTSACQAYVAIHRLPSKKYKHRVQRQQALIRSSNCCKSRRSMNASCLVSLQPSKTAQNRRSSNGKNASARRPAYKIVSAKPRNSWQTLQMWQALLKHRLCKRYSVRIPASCMPVSSSLWHVKQPTQQESNCKLACKRKQTCWKTSTSPYVHAFTNLCKCCTLRQTGCPQLNHKGSKDTLKC